MTFHVFTGGLPGVVCGGEGESTMDKASQIRQIAARKLWSIPVLCPPAEFFRACASSFDQQTDMSTPFQPLDRTGSTGRPKQPELMD